jgi:hypothetical protein
MGCAMSHAEGVVCHHIQVSNDQDVKYYGKDPESVIIGPWTWDITREERNENARSQHAEEARKTRSTSGDGRPSQTPGIPPQTSGNPRSIRGPYPSDDSRDSSKLNSTGNSQNSYNNSATGSTGTSVISVSTTASAAFVPINITSISDAIVTS